MKQQMLEAEIEELKARIETLTAECDALKAQNKYQEKMIRQADVRGDYWKASAEKAEADADATEVDNVRLRDALDRVVVEYDLQMYGPAISSMDVARAALNHGKGTK
jgi:predicted RNase H-like nuclease (RuvC/YqgF family)